jgi:hypothetical protein
MEEWGIDPRFLDLGSFTPLRVPPGKEPLVPISIASWVGPRVGLDAVEKREVLALPGLEP